MLAIALLLSALVLPAPCTHAQLRLDVGRGAAAARDPFVFARARLRAHGGAASALYGQVDTGVYDRARCRPVRARGLRVYAPGQTAAFYAPLPHRACSAHLRDSRVRPLVAGRRAS
jgi:hypothetical protein